MKEIRKNYFNWDTLWNILYREFKRLDNNKLDELMAKLNLIDGIFGTNINKQCDYKELAKILMTIDIDEIIENKTVEEVFREIDKVIFNSDINRHFLVFISKFCHFLNPDKFPLFDQHVWRAISDISSKSENSYKKNLSLSKQDIDKIIKQTRLSLDYKTMDHYLWCYGQYLKYKREGDKNLNRAMKSIIKKDLKLLEELEPLGYDREMLE